jgi:hypothetical protein
MKNNGKTPARRPVEREYCATLNAAVTLDVWKRIVQRAVDDALAGDAKAREWLSKWLMQAEVRTLTVMAAEESLSDPATATELEIADRREMINLNRRKAAAGRQLEEITLPRCR